MVEYANDVIREMVILSVLAPKADPGAVEDGSLVIGNMLLAAHSFGLGSCWIHRARQVFDDPEGIEILKSVGRKDADRDLDHAGDVPGAVAFRVCEGRRADD